MEIKDITKIKAPYVSPEITVVFFSSYDVITASGFDDFDNWVDDNFTIE